MLVGSCHAEQLRLHSQQHIVANVEDSVLRTEMTGLESSGRGCPQVYPLLQVDEIQIDALGDHLCTCITHSGAKKAHDWVVDQLADLFHTTHTVKTQNVTKNRGRHCGNVELTSYLANAQDPGVFGPASPHRPRPFRK
jgi:hypothetical protein